MGLDDQVEKMEMRKNYRNVWHTNLLSTISADTPYCLFSLFWNKMFSVFGFEFIMIQIAAPGQCHGLFSKHIGRVMKAVFSNEYGYNGPCVSYMLRKRALYNDMSRYVCCAGYLPCSGKCGESKCPELCLGTEVVCCFCNSVASTRFLLQDEFNIQTTQCDNCIIGFMFCLQQLACICSLVACITGNDEIGDLAQMLSCLSDLVYCSVCACIQTQHKVEMDKRDGKFGPQPAMAVPSVQQMSRIDQPIPPYAGYAPQQAYGQPYGYPPPPQTQGYPPAYPQPHAYPPHGYSR
ncbi:hypothetical protein NC653_032833 [Populus alba x Populus x berolinensis]|uniref:PLAC8 family protein n=1 Tax=Populus alba x Populus x berolinensis TaxID=444605 RepID=A0AAD6LSA2_9ROSI|nr:hypothetical protein NC653_032833 [Populus alba x Populus x berolinensis]